MNRKKKLPKAIVRPIGEAAAAVSAAQAARVPDNVIEMVPKETATKAEAAAPEAARVANDAEAAKRRRQARKVVERHANLCAVGGAIPLPVANIAGVTGIIVHMVRALCRLHGVPFENDRARTLVVALMGGSMPVGLATATASTLMYLVPGTNMLGLAVSSVTASATARSIGQMLTRHLESGATLADFPALGGR